MPAPLKPPSSNPGPVASVAKRQERRRQETRHKLMAAALRLMSSKGVEGVTIQDITNTADLGFGSFYNHFPSKEAIFLALKDEVIEHFAAALDKLGDQVQDPAEKITASARYTMRHGRADPVWAKFVLATSFNRESLRSGLGRYLLRDLMAGLTTGRFQCEDLPSTLIAVGSIIMGGLRAEVDPPTSPDDAFGPSEDLPERISTIVLTTLGLPAAEARAIATRALPHVDLPVNPFNVAAGQGPH